MNGARRHRRGFTLVELLMGLAVTGVVAAGITAMLGGVATGIAVGTDARTGMLATGIIQGRLAEAVTPAACVLSGEPHRVTLWLGESRPGGLVEPSELAWLTIAPEDGVVRMERVVFPDQWDAITRARVDRPIRANTDPFPVLDELRTLGIIDTEILADGVLQGMFRDPNNMTTSREIRIDLELDLPTGPRPAAVIVVLESHQRPPEWTP
ncbi:MAG: prepilin-type N-terminal cleavage/methylation domain-containing protein [Phycisphaerales bacterium]|nr:prepilin-type N-terminal cleavage/methylation domain-containing protein [Phycisphaerales bacterium]